MNRPSEFAKEGLILCKDERLSRLLENELRGLHISPRVVSSLPADLSGLSILLVDADGFPVPPESLGAPPVILFGRDLIPTAEGDTVRLHRPFALTELESAIRSLSEGLVPPSPSDVASPPPLLSIGTQDVTVAGRRIPLTAGEYAILRCLYRQQGEAVSRQTLSALLGGGGNSVDVYVCKLRTKLEKPVGMRLIHTVRGVGYRLELHPFP